MQSNRKSDVMVKVLDFDSVKPDAIKKLSETDKHTKVLDVSFYGETGFVETSKGIFVLNNDGIGNDSLLNDAEERVPVYGHYLTADGQKVVDAIPVIAFPLTIKNLKTFPVKKEVNLADFIRKFGSRLEGNFESWNTKFSQLK